MVRGRVYVPPAGYPVLTVPGGSILARGSADPLVDVAKQADAFAQALAAPSDEAGDCEDIRGEILVFDDPQERLPRIDALEGFRPSGASLYTRVLLTVRREQDARLVPAWAYVEGDLLRVASQPQPKRQ